MCTLLRFVCLVGFDFGFGFGFGFGFDFVLVLVLALDFGFGFDFGFDFGLLGFGLVWLFVCYIGCLVNSPSLLCSKGRQKDSARMKQTDSPLASSSSDTTRKPSFKRFSPLLPSNVEGLEGEMPQNDLRLQNLEVKHLVNLLGTTLDKKKRFLRSEDEANWDLSKSIQSNVTKYVSLN